MPSNLAASISVSYISGNSRVPIINNKDINAIAGDYLTGLVFKIMDEAGREIANDNNISSKLKVSG